MPKILLVEDDTFFQRTVVMSLGSRGGHKVTLANNADEALERLRSGESFDFIISNNEMPPGMLGVDMLRVIRGDGIKSPFLLWTGGSYYDKGRALTDICKEYGATFSEKIGSPSEIRQLVARILKIS